MAKKPLDVQDAECGCPLRDTAEGKALDGYKISNLKPTWIVIEIKCSSCKEINIIKY